MGEASAFRGREGARNTTQTLNKTLHTFQCPDVIVGEPRIDTRVTNGFTFQITVLLVVVAPFVCPAFSLHAKQCCTSAFMCTEAAGALERPPAPGTVRHDAAVGVRHLACEAISDSAKPLSPLLTHTISACLGMPRDRHDRKRAGRSPRRTSKEKVSEGTSAVHAPV